jgi:hypothetical protein
VQVTAPASYHPGIDGFRAVAVTAVVLFYADVPGFSGGFLGVDVFFVACAGPSERLGRAATELEIGGFARTTTGVRRCSALMTWTSNRGAAASMRQCSS